MKSKTQSILIAVLICTSLGSLHAESVLFGVVPGDRMTMTTRSNVRIHVNGNYLGFRYGEERILLDQESLDADIPETKPGNGFSGNAFVLSNTVRDQRQAARSLDTVVPVSLHIAYDGTYTMATSDPVVAVRSIPSFPDREISPGDTWEAYGEVVVDPFQDGVPTTVPVYIAYRYEGVQDYQGDTALVIHAQYALRYRQGQDSQGDPELQTIQGRHDLQIFMSADGNRPLFIRDTLQDQFLYQDGTHVQMNGFKLTFFDTPRARMTTALRERLENRTAIREQPAPGAQTPAELPDPQELPPAEQPPGEQTTPGVQPPAEPQTEEPVEEQITMDETDIGLRLSLPALRFVADQAVLLPAERNRLNNLAEALREAMELNPDSSFLVVGHTADIGLPESQQELSVERARTIVDTLVDLGLPGDRFLFQGRGGSEPAADNATPEGRALNRRVEVYIIE